MKTRTILLYAILLILTVLLTGCFSSDPENFQYFTRPQGVDVNTDKYVLQPPDEIEVHCSRVDQLNLQTQQIRPDGKVSFEILGEIQAAGKTPSQLSKEMEAKLSDLYELKGDNPIDVRIVSYRSKLYYVLGQVFFSGPKEYTGRETLLKALTSARPTNLAWIERIQVIRASGEDNEEPKIFEFNYEKMISHGELEKNILLEEGDIVYVPPTVLAAIGMKVEEFLSPVGRAFSTVNIVEGPGR